jgi:glucokinase
MPNEKRVVVDLGGTNLRIGYSPDRESLRWTRSYRTDRLASPKEWLLSLLESRTETRDAEWIFGVPGPCDASGPERTPNLPGQWDWTDLGTLLTQQDIPYCFENDANLAALGMARETPDPPEYLLGVTLGTGIGGGIVMDGSLYRGATGAAAEWGHLTLRPDGRRCNCGKTGCFETYASARGLEQTYRERTGDSLSAQEIAQLNSEAARESVHRTGRYLGEGLASITNVLNPDRIVLAGGLARSFELFRDDLRTTFEQMVFAESAERTTIDSCEKDHPALHGGLALSLE